jgi:hypothetical protein
MPRQGPGQVSRFDFVWGGSTLVLVGIDGIDLSIPVKFTDWGAVGDGSTHNAVAVQNAVNWAQTSLLPLHLTNGTFLLEKEILVGGYVKILGDGQQTAKFLTATSSSPVNGFIVQQPGDPAHMPLISSLAAGPGQALQVANTPWAVSRTLSYNINTFNNNTCLDGLSHLNIRFFIQFQGSYINGFPYRIMSAGTDLGGGILSTVDFNLQGYTSSNSTIDTLEISLRTSGGTAHFFATFPSDQNVHNVELDWDGSTLRCFVDGTVASSTACTGTALNPPGGYWYVGTQYYGSLPSGLFIGTADFNLDSFEISNASRHTSTFTSPTSKYTADGNTLYLNNFDQVSGNFIWVQSGGNGGFRYLTALEGMPYLGPLSSGYSTARLDIQDVWLENFYTAIWLNTAQDSQIARVTITGIQGILVGGGGNSTRIRDCQISTINKYGIAYYNAAGDHEIIGGAIISSGSAPVPGLYIGATDTVRIRSLYCVHGVFTTALYRALSILFDGCYFSTEQQVVATNACVAMENADATFTGCDFDTEYNNINAVQVAGLTTALLEHPFYSNEFNTPMVGYGTNVSSAQGSRVTVITPTPFVSRSTHDYPIFPATVYSPDYFECLDSQNKSGTVMISGSSTSGAVTFPVTEHDANYRVKLSVGPSSGSPTLSLATWASKTTGGFTVNLASAPGGGSAVEVDWSIER